MRPDPHASRIAWRIEHQLAPAITAARTALDERLARLDGWSGSSGDPHVATSTNDSTTERHGELRAQLASDHQQLHEDCCQLDDLIKTMTDFAWSCVSGGRRAIEVPDVPLCMEGLAGKEGSIEWGDPTCAMPASKRGLCHAHYLAWWRHRKARGIDVSKDHEPA